MTDATRTSLAQLPVTLRDIERAAGVLGDFVKLTNFDRSRTLSDITGASVWLKFENLQFTATFKERGALNRLSALSADERQRGVIAASAGNHAQGVALAAKTRGIPALIVMPLMGVLCIPGVGIPGIGMPFIASARAGPGCSAGHPGASHRSQAAS